MFAFRLFGKCAAKLQNYPETAILSHLILYIFADLAQKLFSCNHHLDDGLDGSDVHRADALICLLKFLLPFFAKVALFGIILWYTVTYLRWYFVLKLH